MQNLLITSHFQLKSKENVSKLTQNSHVPASTAFCFQDNTGTDWGRLQLDAVHRPRAGIHSAQWWVVPWNNGVMSSLYYM